MKAIRSGGRPRGGQIAENRVNHVEGNPHASRIGVSGRIAGVASKFGLRRGSNDPTTNGLEWVGDSDDLDIEPQVAHKRASSKRVPKFKK